MGSQAGACGAWGEWAGGGELAPPWEEGREGRGSLKSENSSISGAHLQGGRSVWLLVIEGPRSFGVL